MTAAQDTADATTSAATQWRIGASFLSIGTTGKRARILAPVLVHGSDPAPGVVNFA